MTYGSPAGLVFLPAKLKKTGLREGFKKKSKNVMEISI